MIKVLYDNSGAISEFWAINEVPNCNYIEINEDELKKMAGKDNYIVKNGELIDISLTDDYIAKKATEKKQLRLAEIKKQIIELETQQNRAIREFILSGETNAKTKLLELDSKINELRNKF